MSFRDDSDPSVRPLNCPAGPVRGGLRRQTLLLDSEPMPKRSDVDSILVLGSGPIVIGQACEFDYSGTQACRVLRQEGYRVILVNSNPATIMTDPEFADATYVEPLTPEMVETIIERESRRAAADRRRPDGHQPDPGAR